MVVVEVKSALPAVPVVVVKVTNVSAVLMLLKVTGNRLALPSVTCGAVPTLTTGASLVLMVLVTLCVAKAPRTALVGALKVMPKVSAGSPVLSSMVAVRTMTLVTPAGIVMMPLAGTGMKLVPSVL